MEIINLACLWVGRFVVFGTGCFLAALLGRFLSEWYDRNTRQKQTAKHWKDLADAIDEPISERATPRHIIEEAGPPCGFWYGLDHPFGDEVVYVSGQTIDDVLAGLEL